MSKKAVCLSKPVLEKVIKTAGIKSDSSAIRRAKTVKVKAGKKPATKAKFKVVTLFDGRPGVRDADGNVAPFETFLTARRWQKWLAKGDEPYSALGWWNPKLLAFRKAEWEQSHPVVENAPPVAPVTVDTSEPPKWTAPVGMVLLNQAEEAYLRDRASKLSILNAKLKAECEGLRNDVLQAEANSDERQSQVDRLAVLNANLKDALHKEQAEVRRLKANLDPRLSLDAELSRERGESAKWLNKYLQLCQLTGQRAEPEGLDHPACSLKANPVKDGGSVPPINVFEQPASELTKLERAALDLAPMLELSDLDVDVSNRHIERLVDFAASILSECHSQSK